MAAKTAREDAETSPEKTPAKRRTATLAAHIKRIKQAKLDAEKAVETASKMDAARASIEILWEMVFDYLCSAREVSAAEIANLSSVAQRLSSSRVQLANFGAKTESAGQGGGAGRVLPETLAKIENELNLL